LQKEGTATFSQEIFLLKMSASLESITIINGGMAVFERSDNVKPDV
jgi:hypothetical protein